MDIAQKRVKYMNLKTCMKKLSVIHREIEDLEQDRPTEVARQIQHEKRIERLLGQADGYNDWKNSIESDLKARGEDIPETLEEVQDFLLENPTNAENKDTPDFDEETEV